MSLAAPIDTQPQRSDEPGNNHDSQATTAANMAAGWDLWNTPARDAYATVPVDSHHENWPVKSQIFRRYLAKQFFDKEQKVIKSESLSAAINLMEAKALFEGDEHDGHVRIAEYQGTIILDLCNPQWQVVEITPPGWRILDHSPVRFRRSRGMLALPTPTTGGSIDLLRRFLNVDDVSWKMIVAWLLAALRPRGPYPILALIAEQGSGKSTAARLLRSLVDPNSAPLRAEPRSQRDLVITASNSRCVTLDNVSYLPPWLSDAICRLSTGGGFATRELYTDQEEIIFESQRPVLLTSIDDVATRSDLLDRCLLVSLPTIPENRRRREEELEIDFTKVWPTVLGALLDILSGALQELPNTQLNKLPRMADFAHWVTTAEKGLGWPAGTFLKTYTANRESANDLALEASPIGPPLLELLQGSGDWEGTATDLLAALEETVTEQTKRQKSWPKNGRSMATHLKRIAPNLRAAGWDVEYSRHTSRRTWSIRPMTQTTPDDVTQTDADETQSVMQNDAEPCQSCHDDANDANDANAGPFYTEGGQADDNCEVGDL